MLEPRISIRKRVNLKKQRLSSKQRAVGTYLGKLCTAPPVYNAGSGMTYVGPQYPEYPKRTNSDSAYECYIKAKLSPNTTTVAGGYTVSYGQEEINGSVGNRGGMNNVVHLKDELVNLPFMVMYDYKGRYYYHDYYRFGCYSAIDRQCRLRCSLLSQSYYPGSDPFFSGRAYWSMRPKFEGDVSLINSLYELKDFKDVMHIGKVVDRLKRVALTPDYQKASRVIQRSIKQYGTGLNMQTLNKLSSDSSSAAASAVLAWNLAIKPTIADVLAITAQFGQDVLDAEKEFASMGDDGALSHFSENIVLSSPSKSTDPMYHWVATGTHTKIVQTATMRSFYQYKARSMMEALVKYWGLAGTVEAVWNMLPLSFVLDYVFTVGKALSYMQRDDNVLNLHVDYCESVKIISTNGTHIRQTSSTPCVLVDGNWKVPPSTAEKYHLVSGTRSKRYARIVMDPYRGPALPKFKVPSFTQGLNMLALARVFCK